MEEHASDIARLLWGLLGLAGVGLVSLFMWRIKRLEFRMGRIEDKVERIEKDEIKNFDELKIQISENRRIIIEELQASERRMLADFVRRVECPFLHRGVHEEPPTP